MICLMAGKSAHFDDSAIGGSLSSIIKQAFFLVSEFIGSDWRNLARQLGITEYDIVRIDSKACDQHSAASEMLHLFHSLNPRNTDCQIIQQIVCALMDIGRFSLAARINSLK